MIIKHSARTNKDKKYEEGDERGGKNGHEHVVRPSEPRDVLNFIFFPLQKVSSNSVRAELVKPTPPSGRT